MIKQSFSFNGALFQKELIVHDKNDVDVIWIGLVRHITPKHNYTRQMIGSLRQSQDVKQTSGNKFSLLSIMLSVHARLRCFARIGQVELTRTWLCAAR